MAWKPQRHEDFKVNFTSFNQAWEWVLLESFRTRSRACIMGRSEKISATKDIESNIPDSWKDKTFLEEKDKIEKGFNVKKMQCHQKEGTLSHEKYNDALDEWADNMHHAMVNLLFRIGKLPQKSEISYSNPME